MHFVYHEGFSDRYRIREYQTRQEALDAISDSMMLRDDELYMYRLFEGRELDLSVKPSVVVREGREADAFDNVVYALEQYVNLKKQIEESPNNFKNLKLLPKELIESIAKDVDGEWQPSFLQTLVLQYIEQIKGGNRRLNTLKLAKVFGYDLANIEDSLSEEQTNTKQEET